MIYKPTLVSPNRKSATSPLMVRKTSLYQALPQNTYYTSIRTTPMKNTEQKFENPTEICRTLQNQSTPDKFIRRDIGNELEIQKQKNDYNQKEQEIANLQRALEISNEDRNRLRYALEQKAIICVNKEREIAHLLATIHQLELKRGDQNIIKEQQNQIESLKAYIHSIVNDNSRKQSTDENSIIRLKFKELEEENHNCLKEMEQMHRYIKELVQQNKECEQKYQDKCIELQRLEIETDTVQLLQRQLKGKEDEIDILKSELRLNGKEFPNFEPQNEIQKFLEQIKKQYLEDSSRPHIESDCASFDNGEVNTNSINIYNDQQKQLYSFSSKKDEESA